MKILVLNNHIEYNKLKESGFDFDGYTLLSTSIELILICKKNNLDFINPWEFLDNETVSISEEKTIEHTLNFKSFLGFDVDFLGIDIIEITKIFFRYSVKAYFHTIYVLDKIFSKYRIGSINFVKNYKTPFNVAFFDRSSLFSEMVRNYSLSKKITIKSLDYDFSEDSNYTNPCLKVNPAEFGYLTEGESISGKKYKSIFILSENFEWDFDLVRYIEKNTEDNLVIWRSPNRGSFISNDKFNLFFDDFKFSNESLINFTKRIDSYIINFSRNVEEDNSDSEEILMKKSLTVQIKDYLERIKSYASDILAIDRIITTFSPLKIYFSNSWDMSVRCMVKRAMNFGCETYCSIHGGVVDNSGYLTRAFEVDNYLVWGKDNFEGLVKAGQSPESIKIVGSMQMDFWKDRFKEYNTKNSSDNNTEYSGYYNFDSSNINADEKFTVTFFTSAGGGFTGHSIQEYYHLNSLEKIKALSKKHPDILFKIKPHVIYDYRDFWAEFKKNLPNNLEVINEKDLLKACIELNFGVLLNTISNVAYEISLAGKPIIFLKNACFNVEFAESGIERGGILCINSVDEFETYLLNYLKSDEMKSDLQKRRKQFLEFNLIDDGKSTKERIMELINKTASKKIHSENSKDENILSIIEWVRKSVHQDIILKFPEIKYNDFLPKGNYFKSRLYSLAEGWCRYYDKTDKLNLYYTKLLFAVPPQFKISLINKVRSSVYSKTRDIYLKYNFDKRKISKYFRNKRKLIES